MLSKKCQNKRMMKNSLAEISAASDRGGCKAVDEWVDNRLEEAKLELQRQRKARLDYLKSMVFQLKKNRLERKFK